MEVSGIDKPVSNRMDQAQRAYQSIKKMLFYDEIGPNQKIHIRDLAKRLGMSTTPVVQALQWLEIQDLISREYNRGYYTEGISMKQVEEIYELREIVEVSLLPKTIARLDEEGIKRLHAANQAHVRAAKYDSLAEKLMKDMELHLILASLSGCFTQQRVLNNLFERLYLKYRGSYYFHHKPRVEDEHGRIVEAVISRDSVNAKKWLSKHIRGIKEMALAELGRRLKDREMLDF